MSNIAIIPARGGSKRIPKKNIKLFLDKPIIAYSIELALKSGLFDEVMVSTDEPEIAKIAQEYGAKVPFYRSLQNSNDYASTTDVLLEVMKKYEEEQNQIFQFACCIYPTAPLIKDIHLKQGLKLLQDNKFTSVFPIVKYSHPIWRAINFENNKAKFIWDENVKSRSQDLSNSYHDAGQWYWFKPNKIKTESLSDNFGVLILNEEDVQDIDNPSDWALAEIKYKLKDIFFDT